MKILLLGKNGQVGRELQRSLLPLGEVTSLGREEADLEVAGAVTEILKSYTPDIVVNAAAYTAVDKAETDEKTAREINSLAVEAIAKYAHATNSLLVHYSTDYVFDGEKREPYVETDYTNPKSVYGRTKLAGERAIIDSGCQALIFRTSWVFSCHGANFVKTIMRLAQERTNLRVVSDQVGAPTCAELIADVTAIALATYKKYGLPTGVYNLAAAGETSWYDFAVYITRRLVENGVNLKLETNSIAPIPANEYPAPAQRPQNSRLNTTKLSEALGLEIPHWSVYADRTIDELTRRTEN